MLGAVLGGCNHDSEAKPKSVENAEAGQEESPSAPEEKGSADEAGQEGMDVDPAQDPEPEPAESSPVLGSMGESPFVAVPGELSLCDQDADCAVVETACDGCCAVGAINEASVAMFTEKKQAACAATASGAECDCKSPSVVTVCDSYRGQCVLVPGDGPEESDAECFSPFQNIDRAYMDGGEGCACEGDTGVCVAGAALICAEGRWSATQDGPCQPRTGDASDGCSAGERHPTAVECMQAHATCQLGEDGFFCGLD